MRIVRLICVTTAGLMSLCLSGCAESAPSAEGADARLSVDPALLKLPEPLPGVWSPVVGKTPQPFWRRGDQPTYAPEWYAHRGPVTREIAQVSDESPERAGQRVYQALQSLTPGDHLVIREGTYSIAQWLTIRSRGTAEKPIIIRGAAGENVVLTRPDAKKNVIDINGAQYVAIESLQIRGGSNAVKIYTADHIMLYDLEVTKTAGVAIAANSRDTSYLTIVDCDISHAGKNGEGIYVGRANGKIITHHTAIVGNYIHDLVGPKVKQGDGIEVKQGSYAVWIKYNFVRNTNYPGIIVYGTGRGIEDRNVIEENVIVDSRNYPIQACADAVIRNNLVVNTLPGGKAFVSKPEAGTTPGNLLITNNTFLAEGRAISCFGWDSPESKGIVFANNAYYSETAEGIYGTLGNATDVGNLYVTNLDEFEKVNLSDDQLDAVPAENSRLIGAGVPSLTPETDLNGVVRDQSKPVVGAMVVPAD